MLCFAVFALAFFSVLQLPAAQVSANALVLVNSQSAKYPDFQHFIQPYLDNFGFPYVVQDISTNAPSDALTNYAIIIIGHSQIDTNQTYLTTAAQTSISLAVSNGTGLVNFDNSLSSGGAGRYQFVQNIFGFTYSSSAQASSVGLPPTEPGSQMHYITGLHPTNDTVTFRSSITLPGIGAPAGVTTLASAGGKPLVLVHKYGQGRAVQWGSYDWMVSTVLGPVDGLDDLVWRGVVWAARKPFVMRGMPNLITMRVDDVSGPLGWAHVANESGFKPLLAAFINEVSAADAADIRGLVTNGNATACVHSFASSTMFYFDHQNETAYSDIVQSNNFLIGTQWHLTNGIPISKVCATHYSEIGANAFAGLKAWGMEFVPIEVIPGTVEYAPPYAPWLVGGPYRLYESPQQGQVNWPTYYADWLKVPGHPEFDGQFFNIYSEVRDVANCGEWCPDNDVTGSIGRGTAILKRALDSMVMATLFTHEWYFHPTPCCGGTTITTNNLRATFQGITNNLAAYKPTFVTLDYANQYVRATRTSRLVSGSIDSASGKVSATLTGKTDLDTIVYVFTGADGAITYTLGNVPAFPGNSNNTVVVSGPPEAATLPASRTNNAGTTATFSVGAIGASPFTYQWLKNGTNALSDGGSVRGATNAMLTLNSVLGNDAGSYSVIVGNALGSITSAPAAILTVVDPVINNQPANVAVLAGGTAQLSVVAAGTLPVYQWFRGGSPLAGATAPALTLTNVSFSDATNYSVLVSSAFGSVMSATATLSILTIPSANNDSYATPAGTTLFVGPPGVLGNDSDSGGNLLTATLVTAPLHGALKLSEDGEITFVPESNFVGTDTFTYRAANALTSSAPATVSLSITSDVEFVSDDFTRLTDPGILSPWTAQSGNWTVTGGALQGGSNPLQTYGFAYLTGAFTNFVVESQLRFSSTSAYGGGIGGRLNPATGAHYAAWLYPEASTGGSNMLKLIKFQTWNTFGYNGVSGAAMQTVNLASVGTNWHTLKLACHNSRIAVYLDGLKLISVTDTEAQPYLSGGISADMWTPATAYQMFVDKVTVSPLVVNDAFNLGQDPTLTILAPGVLTNDTAVYGTTLTATVTTPPAHGSASLNTNGGFTYTPTLGYSGSDSFIYQAIDGSNILGSATVIISVASSEYPLIVQQPGDVTTNAGATVYLSATAMGNAPLSYQWYFNATNSLRESTKFTGATNAALSISNVLGRNGGYYTLIVSNSVGSTTSSPPTRLVVIDPIITSQPVSRTNVPGTTATFSIGAYGTAPQYQWFKAGNPIAGATANSLKLTPISALDAANYTVTASNRYGFLTSAIAQLVVVPRPTIASVQSTNGIVTISWNSFPGQTYRVQYRNSFADPIWHDVQPDVVATGTFTSFNAPLGNLSQRLYRVILVVPLESPLMITSFSQTNGAAVITWNSVSGQNYHLQYQDHLGDTWHDLLPGVTASSATANATDAVGFVQNRYYRVALGQGVPPPPVINALPAGSGMAVLTWNSVAGQTYRLQYRDSLGNPVWQNVPSDIVATGPSTTQTNTIDAVAQRFFRVVLLP